MKGFYSLMVGALLLCCNVLSAQTPLSISIESASETVGQQICLDITGDDFDNISGFQFSIAYDPAVLEFVSQTGQTLVGQPVFIQNSAAGSIRVSWNTFGATGIIETEPFLIGEICFNVLRQVETVLMFSDTPIRTEVLDGSGSNISNFVTNNGIVNQGSGSSTCSDGIMNGSETGVDCGGPDCMPCSTMSGCVADGTNLTLCVDEVCDAAVGTQVCLDVDVSNFTTIAGVQFRLNYPESNLTFANATGNDALVGIQFNTTTVGRVNVLWFDQSVALEGVTLPASSTLATFCFTVTDAAASAITITDESFGDANQQTVMTTISNGSVNGCGASSCTDGIMNGDETGIDCGGSCSPCPTCSDGIMNGDETGVDCGGSCATACPTCTDGIMNGNETGVDCGGSCTPCQTSTDDLVFSMSSGSGGVGTQVCVDITTQNFTSVIGFQYSINYDPAVLSFVNSTNRVFPDLNVIQPGAFPGQIRVTWNYFNSDNAGETLADGSRVFTLCFNVLQETGTNVTFSGNPIGIEAFNNSNTSLNVMLNSGTINGGGSMPTCSDGIMNGDETGVDCGGSCTACPTCSDGIMNGNETGVDCGGSCTPCQTSTDDLVFSMSSGSGGVGTQVCVDVTTQNFTSIIGFQYSINYDPAVLSFVNSTNQVFPDLNIIQPGAFPGQIRVTWNYFNSDNAGETLADGSRVFTLCFNVLQETGTSVTFSGNPIGIEAFDNNNTSLNVMLNSGTINGGGNMPTCTDGIMNGDETGVDCGGSCTACPTCSDGIMNGNETGVDCGGSCTPCQTSTDDLTFSMSSGSGGVGTQVCVDVTTQNFTSIIGFQYSINYDPAVLSFVNSTNQVFSDLNIIQPGAFPGQIRVTWNYFNSDNAGETLADGSRVFTLCFNVLQETPTNVMFSGNPIGIEAFDNNNTSLNVVLNSGTINGGGSMPTCSDGIMNGDETGVDCGGSCAPCQTTSDCTVSGNALTLCVDDICDATVGSQVCLDVDVSNFTTIAGVQFRLNYPTSNLTFVSGTGNGALAGMQFNSGTAGRVGVLWFDQSPTLEGVTLEAGSTLATFCFTVTNAATSSVTITNESFGNAAQQTVAATINDGSVNGANCGNTPTCTDGIMNGDETGVDCGGSCMPCSTCSDGIMNGDETGVDCGGSCAPCQTTSGCTVNGNDLTLCVDDICDATVGSQVCLDVDVSNFTTIAGVQFRLNYPTSNLTFVSGTGNGALAGMQFNSGTAGRVGVLWFDQSPTLEGVTLEAGSTLATFCFTVTNAATSSVTITNESFGNAAQQTVAATINDGSVNAANCGNTPTCTDGIMNGDETGVDCGGSCTPCSTCSDGIMNGDETGVDCGGSCAPCQTTSDCTVNGNDLTLCVDDICDATVGSQVCLDVDVSNFTTIAGVQFRLNYPTSNLTFVSGTGNGALAGMQFNSGTAGRVGVLWFDQSPTLEGVTLEDGSTLATFCFTVTNAATSSVTITNESFGNAAQQTVAATINDGSVNAANCGNTPTCTDGIMNGDETGVDCGGSCAPCSTCSDGIMNGDETGVDCGGSCAPCQTTSDCTVNGNDLTLCVDDICDATVGSQVCLDVDVSNFTTIAGVQFRLNYPTSNLTFVSGTGNGALAGMQFNSGTAGRVGVLWFDQSPTLEGVTLEDGSTLATFCFTVTNAATSSVTITNESFGNAAQQTVAATINDGSVNGANCGMTQECNMNGIQDGMETGVDCGGPLCPPCTTGQEDLTINIGSANATVGSQACVDVTVQDFTNMQVLDLVMSFDASALQVASIVATTQLPGFNAGNFSVNQAAGTIGINWTGDNGAALSDNAVLFTICFNTLTEGMSTLSFTDASSGRDGDDNDVNLILNSGTVNAVNSFDGLTFAIGMGNGPANSQVCLDIPVYNFTNITGFSFTINYDPLKLSYDDVVANVNFPMGGQFQISNANPGEIGVLWQYIPVDFAGITVPDGTVVAQVCFDVLIACDAPVTITGSAVDIGAADNNGTSLPVSVINGGVNLGIACDGGTNPENLIIDIQDGTGLAGEEVCVDVLVTNFTSIRELSFTMNYDADVLTFSGVNNFGLSSIISADFVVGPLGTITFDWDSPSNLGQTIAAGGRMFTLCFTVNDVVQTPVNFSSTPTVISARNGAGSSVGVIPMNGMINPSAPLGDELALVICCVDGEVGDIVNIDVKAFNFENIEGFQFSGAYDPAKLMFRGVNGTNALDDIFLTSNPGAGELRIQWSMSGGQSLPDGTVLMSWQFEILDADAATVAFSNTPIGVEFIDVNNTMVDVNLISCAINGSGRPEIVNAEITQPTCHDDTDGSITVTVTGPTNLSYVWSPTGTTGPTLSNVGPGTYTVQVINNDTGESTAGSYTIPAGQELIVSEGMRTDVSCFGAADGSATVSIQQGSQPVSVDDYTIDWSGSLPDGVIQQLQLDEGTYGVTVTDNNGCARSLSININEPSEPDFDALVTDISETPGRIDLTVVANSGTPDYNFSWTGPNAFTATTEDIDNLTVPGLYCVIMLDANGCDRSECFTVEEALRISNVDIVSGCFGGTGAIDITVTGGNGTYSYAWTGPGDFTAITEDVSGLVEGIYVVTVTSGDESVSGSYTLDMGTEITATASVSAATNGSNGTIDLSPTGGVQPYNYMWSNGETTQDLNDLAAGEYCVTITDSQGCSSMGADSCFVVEAEALAVATTTTVNASCAGETDGVVTIIMSNGAAPFSAVANPGGIMATSDTDTLVFNLGEGNYDITITDSQGGSVPQSAVVTAPDPIILTSSTIVSDADDGECSGSITINPVGGTMPYNVSWNVPLSGTQITEVCAGFYTATVEDANGCLFVFDSLEVVQITADAQITNVACEGDATGSIDLTVNSGVAPFNFEWTAAGDPTVIATTEDISGVTDGTYNVVITDATGAPLTRTFNIETSLGFSIAAQVTTNFNGSSVTCNGASDGAARVDISGLGSYSYEWRNSDGVVGTDSVVTGLAAGDYEVIVTSGDGCVLEQTVTITEPDAIEVMADISNVSCFEQRDGGVRLTVNGGTPEYEYEWSNGGTLSEVRFLTEGTYDVFIADANGCMVNASYEITGPPELLVTTETTDADDGCNGTITIIPLAGTGNYNYRWLQLPNQENGPIARNLCPGEYTIEVFDGERCQTITVVASVRDRRFPCLEERNVITPNGDGLNENFILFCTDGSEITRNTLQIFNRWGQKVYEVNDYNCSTDGGMNCFNGKTNDGAELPAGPYYYVLDYTNPIGELKQKRGSITIVLE